MVRADLASSLGISQASLANLLKRLFAESILIESGKASSQGGRRASTLALHTDLIRIEARIYWDEGSYKENYGGDIEPIDSDTETVLGQIVAESRTGAQTVAAFWVPKFDTEVFLDFLDDFSGVVRRNSVEIPIFQPPFPVTKIAFTPKGFVYLCDHIENEVWKICEEYNYPKNVMSALDIGSPLLLKEVDKLSEEIGKMLSVVAETYKPQRIVCTFGAGMLSIIDKERVKKVFSFETDFSIQQDVEFHIEEMWPAHRMEGLAHIALREFLLKIEQSNVANSQK